MGVDTHNYIIIGANIGDLAVLNFEDDDEYEKTEEYRDRYSKQKQPGDMIYLDDCYGGKYFYVGEVIQADYEGYNGFTPMEIDTDEDKFAESKIKVKNFILEKFNVEINPKIVVMTHYT
ncbi:hypothetical protein [Paenibacillus sp. FSL H3-0333]|uniref:hypothetical protein n=1 Tax=Paenibacillus sp. FSL H3-0333 TaxID=2921373 RepID=UPI0030F5B6EB